MNNENILKCLKEIIIGFTEVSNLWHENDCKHLMIKLSNGQLLACGFVKVSINIIQIFEENNLFLGYVTL